MAKLVKKLSNGQIGDEIGAYGEAISNSVRNGNTPIFAFGKENGHRYTYIYKYTYICIKYVFCYA